MEDFFDPEDLVRQATQYEEEVVERGVKKADESLQKSYESYFSRDVSGVEGTPEGSGSEASEGSEGTQEDDYSDGGSDDGEGVAEFKDRARTSKLIDGGPSTVGGKIFYQNKTAMQLFKEKADPIFTELNVNGTVKNKVLKSAEDLKNIHIYNPKLFILAFMFEDMKDTRLNKENLEKFIKKNNLKKVEHIQVDMIRYIRFVKNI